MDLAGSSSSGATASAQLSATVGLSAFTLATSIATATLRTAMVTSLTGVSFSLSRGSALLTLRAGLVGSSESGAQTAGVLEVPGEVDLTGSSTSGSTGKATLTGTLKEIPEKYQVKQRIQNALYSLIKNGEFYSYTVNPTTGQMTVNMAKKVKPTGVTIHESRTGYQEPKRFRRSYGGSELASWSFTAKVTFAGHALCEVFEQAATDAGIEIPPIEGVPNQRRILARLSDAIYDHGPEQDPAQGTVVEFLFEIETKLLRK